MMTGQMNDAQWNHLRAIGNLHNEICFNGTKQNELNEYVIKHEEELAHEIIVETIMENVELTDDFIRKNEEYVRAVYRIAKKLGDDSVLDSFRSAIRVESFFQLVHELDQPKA